MEYRILCCSLSSSVLPSLSSQFSPSTYPRQKRTCTRTRAFPCGPGVSAISSELKCRARGLESSIVRETRPATLLTTQSHRYSSDSHNKPLYSSIESSLFSFPGSRLRLVLLRFPEQAFVCSSNVSDVRVIRFEGYSRDILGNACKLMGNNIAKVRSRESGLRTNFGIFEKP